MNWPVFWAALAALAAACVPVCSLLGWIFRTTMEANNAKIEASQARFADEFYRRVNGTYKKTEVQNIVNDDHHRRLLALESEKCAGHEDMERLREDFDRSQHAQDQRIDKLSLDMSHLGGSMARMQGGGR